MYTLDLENHQLKPVLRSVFCSLSWIHCLSCLPADIVNYEFDTKNLVCLVISTFVGVWYLLKKVGLTIICPSWPLTPAYLILMNWEWSIWLLAKTAVAVTQWYTAYFEGLALLACWTLYCPLKAVENWVVVFVARQHWIANNLFGLAFALNGVELLHLNNVSTGCILLGGLFVYDVFWVSWCAFCNRVSIPSRQITVYEDVVLLNSQCW